MSFAGNSSQANLTKILCAEMSAVETYDHALHSFKPGADREQLESARACHVKRVDALAGKLYEMGGSPTESSGVWGAYTRKMDSDGNPISEKKAVDMLEEGEEKGIQQYKELLALSGDEPAVKELAAELLSQQQETQRMIKKLQSKLSEN